MASSEYKDARKDRKNVYFNYRRLIVKNFSRSTTSGTSTAAGSSTPPGAHHTLVNERTNNARTPRSGPSPHQDHGLSPDRNTQAPRGTPSSHQERAWGTVGTEQLGVTPLPPSGARYSDAASGSSAIEAIRPTPVSSPSTRPKEWPPVPEVTASPLSSPLGKLSPPSTQPAGSSMVTRSQTGK